MRRKSGSKIDFLILKYLAGGTEDRSTFRNTVNHTINILRLYLEVLINKVLAGVVWISPSNATGEVIGAFHAVSRRAHAAMRRVLD
jgi:hypothetical protein